MPPLLLCAMPMETEAAPKGWPVEMSGPGFRAAEAAARAGIELYRPELVISMGTCGALRPSIGLGEVFTATRILSPHREFSAVPLRAAKAVVYSQDRVASTATEKAHLASMGGDLVEMEAAAVAKVCEELKVPFACLKAVSDVADEDMPLDFNLYRDEQGRFQSTKIAFAGIMKIGGLLRMQRQSRIAVQKLGEALVHAL